MTNKDRLRMVLDGGVPDYPPHFELEFQLGKEWFGFDPADAGEDLDRWLGLHIELQLRLVEELGYASAAFSPRHDIRRGVGEVKKAIGDRALLRTHEWDGVFWMPSGSEMMDFVTKLFEQPEVLHAQARKKCDGAKDRLRQWADAGVDFFVLAYDFGFNRGPFISPTHFREFITPYLTEIVATAHDLGKKAILHSDGDIRLLLDQLRSAGLDGYQSVDPQGFMDIKAVREQYPDWILMGNVQCSTLQNVEESAIRESVRYCMTHGGMGKRYIFSTSNCIFAGMPPQSYRIMLDEYQRMIREFPRR